MRQIQERTKALPHYTMPGGLKFAVKILLYECCDVLFDIMKLQSLQKYGAVTATAVKSTVFQVNIIVPTRTAQVIASCCMSSRMSTDFTFTRAGAMLSPVTYTHVMVVLAHSKCVVKLSQVYLH